MSDEGEHDRFADYINPQVDKSYAIRARLTNQIAIPEFIHIGRVATDEPWDFIEHPQATAEYHYIVAGGMRTWINGEEVAIAPGQFYFVEAGQLHQEASEGTPLEFYYIKFNLFNLRGERLPLVRGGRRTAQGQILPPDDGTFRSLFERIFAEAAADQPGCNEIIESYLLTLVWETRRRMDALVDGRRAVPTRQREMVTMARHRLQQNLGTPFSLEDLARYCAMSPDHLSRMFKDVVGLTPVQFSSRVRAEAAKEYLAGSSKSIKEIALALGYQDEYYFSRRFKALEGVTPTEFRRSVEA